MLSSHVKCEMDTEWAKFDTNKSYCSKFLRSVQGVWRTSKIPIFSICLVSHTEVTDIRGFVFGGYTTLGNKEGDLVIKVSGKGIVSPVPFIRPWADHININKGLLLCNKLYTEFKPWATEDVHEFVWKVLEHTAPPTLLSSSHSQTVSWKDSTSQQILLKNIY